MADLVVVKAKLKEVVKNMNFSSDFAEELDKKVRNLIKEAANRAKENGRKTVMPKDL